MEQSSSIIDVYLEIGQKRTFAGALAWPGWCRSGRDVESALQTLFEYGPRYARVLHAAHLPFHLPVNPSALVVVERLTGSATTDFGAPDITPSADTQPLDAVELQRFQKLLQASWRAFDAAVQAAEGKQLRVGPRGGGRSLAAIVEHVQAAERSYLTRLAWKDTRSEAPNRQKDVARTRQAILDALEAATRGALPKHGPRGGTMWTPRYFTRRVAWHVLDHLWEIENRLISS